MVRHITQERNILATANHPFVVTCHYAFTSAINAYLVMDYVAGGDCCSLLENVGALDEDTARQYAAELVCALDYLHSNGIVHRDVKPSNILIGEDGHIRLTDFGLSAIGHGMKNTSMLNICLETQKSMNSLRSTLREDANPERNSGSIRNSCRTILGTPDYLAPEVLNGGNAGPETDWWSVGAVLFELITGYPPFCAETVSEIFDNLSHCNIQWPHGIASDQEPIQFSSSAKDLVMDLLCTDPKKRLGCHGSHEIKDHPFFADIQWDALIEQEAPFIPQLESKEDVSYFSKAAFSRASIAQDLNLTAPRQGLSIFSSNSLETMPQSKLLKEIELEEDLFSGFSFSSPR